MLLINQPVKRHPQQAIMPYKASIYSLNIDILYEVLSWLHLADLSILAQVDNLLRAAVHRRVQSMVRQVINSFGLDSETIFGLLFRTGSVIAGSAALRVLFPGDNHISYRPRDLDFYVPIDMERTFTDFFEHHTTFRLEAPSNRYYNASIKRVLVLKNSEHSINIVVSNTRVSILPVFHFHSTAVMNFISSTGIYCAYPSLTFQKRSLVNPLYPWKRSTFYLLQRCLQKYVKRGFETRFALKWKDTLQHECGKEWFCPHTVRSITDGGGFFYAFNSRTWIPKGQEFSVVDCRGEAVTWCLARYVCGG